MIQREIGAQIGRLMGEHCAVTVSGPRQCGKTTLARGLFPQFSYADLEDMGTRSLALHDPEEFFTRYPEPVIIDGIQRVPDLLGTVQVRIDRAQKKGQYLIIGSQQIPPRGTAAQPLAGRTALVQMQPPSLAELAAAGIELDRDTQLVTGCMPGLHGTPGLPPAEYYRGYVTTFLERDIAQAGAVHDLMRFERFMRLLAGRTGLLVNNSALAGEVGVTSTTLGTWLALLEASHVVQLLRPWCPSRSSQIVKTPKLYFCDTGLAAYLLGIEAPAQMQRDPLLGNLFENLVVMEALKARLNSGAEPNLFFFRNSKGLTVDLILPEAGTLRLFEIRSGKAQSDEFLRNMTKFAGTYAPHLETGAERGTVIYSGEDAPSYQGFSFLNFRTAGAAFRKHAAASPGAA